MPATHAPGTALLDLARRAGLAGDDDLAPYRGDPTLAGDALAAAAALVAAGLVTRFQAKQLMAGRADLLAIGPYRVLDEIGRGGMGVVYLAEHPTLRRKAAVKVPTAGLGETPVARARFVREARVAAALDHPNVVRLFDVGQTNDGNFIAMEYIDGRTLGRVIADDGPLDPAVACGYVAQAAAGLQAAHERGLVHRDIKPANLMVDQAGTVKVLDLGLARSTEDPADQLTGRLDPDALLGTADYIAPEQALNSPNLDIRADIYALGATFFYLLTGRTPFEGTTTRKLVQRQLSSAPLVTTLRSDVPAGIAEVVAGMMARNPADRYQTPAEVIEALAPWTGLRAGRSRSGIAVRSAGRSTAVATADLTRRLDAEPVVEVAPAPAPVPVTPPAPRSRRAWAIAGAVGLATLAALAVVLAVW
jgi:serine/threonine protein kinase